MQSYKKILRLASVFLSYIFLFLTWVRYNFSPTNYTNFTSLFSLKRLFLPQITQITRIHFSFFSIRSLTASNALYGFAQILALRQLLFLDMKTREQDLLSRRLFSPTDCTELTFYCVNSVVITRVALWYIYPIFIVYLWYIYHMFIVCLSYVVV